MIKRLWARAVLLALLILNSCALASCGGTTEEEDAAVSKTIQPINCQGNQQCK